MGSDLIRLAWGWSPVSPGRWYPSGWSPAGSRHRKKAVSWYVYDGYASAGSSQTVP